MKISGMEGLERKMKQLSDVARKEAKQEALHTGAVLVQGDATLRAPVGVYSANAGVYRSGPMKGQGRVGGNLRSSLDYEAGSEDAEIFATAEYAIEVEYGTSNKAAQPYLRPALDNNKSNIIKIFSEIYAKYLKR